MTAASHHLSLADVDPSWAWSAYQPSDAAPWNRTAVAHLYRRAGFSLGLTDLERVAKLTPAAAVDQLLNGGAGAAQFNKEMDDLAASTMADNKPEGLAAGWLYRMAGTPQPLLEKLTLFWHGHFATGAEKVREARMMVEQNSMLRRNALGPFGQMVQDVSRDAAMLVYLDSVTNRKAHPNENYARELMELFCLGVGNYTERDVQELARCFTGWEVSRNLFRFNEQQHDFGSKTILGQTGPFDGGDGAAIVVQQPAACRFIAGKLLRYFVTDDPQVPDALLQPVADILQKNNFVIAEAVQRIFSSQIFFSHYAVGRKVRSPVELAVGLLRALDGRTNFNMLSDSLKETGQSLFYPPSVKGWDGGRTWINSSTLVSRTNLVRRLVHHSQSKFSGGDLGSWAERYQINQPEKIVDALSELLLPLPPPAEVRTRLVSVARGETDRSRRIGEVLHAMSTLPEFQLN